MQQQQARLQFTSLPDEALVRLDVLRTWGLIPFSTSTLWRKVRSHDFPAPIKASPNVTAWRVGDVREWLSSPDTYRTKRVGGHGR